MSYVQPNLQFIQSTTNPNLYTVIGARLLHFDLNAPRSQGVNEDTQQPNPPKYGCTWLFRQDDTAAWETFRQICYNAIVSKLKGDVAAANAIFAKLQLSADKMPMRPNALAAGKPGYEGCNYSTCGAKAENPPLLLANYADPQNPGKPARLQRPAGEFTRGCQVNIQIEVYFQDHKKNGQRVNANLLAVQYAGPGAPIAGGFATAEDDAFAQFATAQAPVVGMPAAPGGMPAMGMPAAPGGMPAMGMPAAPGGMPAMGMPAAPGFQQPVAASGMAAGHAATMTAQAPAMGAAAPSFGSFQQPMQQMQQPMQQMQQPMQQMQQPGNPW